MHRYVLKRLVHLVPVLFVVSVVVFSITLLLPGDPTLAILGEQASQAERLALREKMGLDRPVLVQYATWLGQALAGGQPAEVSLQKRHHQRRPQRRSPCELAEPSPLRPWQLAAPTSGSMIWTTTSGRNRNLTVDACVESVDRLRLPS